MGQDTLAGGKVLEKSQGSPWQSRGVHGISANQDYRRPVDLTGPGGSGKAQIGGRRFVAKPGRQIGPGRQLRFCGSWGQQDPNLQVVDDPVPISVLKDNAGIQDRPEVGSGAGRRPGRWGSGLSGWWGTPTQEW